MAAPRIAVSDEGRAKDEENAKMDDSPTSKKPRIESRLPLTRWELVVSLSVFFIFSIGLLWVYMKMPASEHDNIKLPRTISDLRLLKYLILFPSFLLLVHCFLLESFNLSHF